MIQEKALEFRSLYRSLEQEIHKRIVGLNQVVEHVIDGLFLNGHILLEGVPGLGKTLLVKTLSETLDLSFGRIQFTPDLMPADILGTNIIFETSTGQKEFRFQRGPIFTNILLADEINRATPKTQSALLEAMQEHAVTVAGIPHSLEQPFYVLATQNPIEMEGTYPLPEAQLDRFLYKVLVPFPSEEDLKLILTRTTGEVPAPPSPVCNREKIREFMHLILQVPVPDAVLNLATRIVMSTHPENPDVPDFVRRYVRYGSSPRGAQALILSAKIQALKDGRFNASCDDLRHVALPCLRHRLILSIEGQAENISTDELIEKLKNTWN